MGSRAQKYHTQQTHYLRKTINYSDAGIATGVSVGKIPNNARILRSHVSVETAFNAGTTNPINVGTVAETAPGVSGAFAAPVNLNNGVNGAVLALTSTSPASPNQVVSNANGDIDVVASFVGTGTAATAGKAEIIVEYVA